MTYREMANAYANEREARFVAVAPLLAPEAEPTIDRVRAVRCSIGRWLYRLAVRIAGEPRFYR